jgi:ssDNA-binding Zn-finger/Zn-ribbon topoisomerase 1
MSAKIEVMINMCPKCGWQSRFDKLRSHCPRCGAKTKTVFKEEK